MLPNADKEAITGIEDIFTRTLEKKNYERDTPKNHDHIEVEWRLGNEQKKRRWNFHSIAFCIYRIFILLQLLALYRVLRRLRVRSE